MSSSRKTAWTTARCRRTASANTVVSSRRIRYALIIVQVGGEELRIQPIDYVGTPLLEAGRYTYALNLTIEGQLTLATRNALVVHIAAGSSISADRPEDRDD